MAPRPVAAQDDAPVTEERVSEGPSLDDLAWAEDGLWDERHSEDFWFDDEGTAQGFALHLTAGGRFDRAPPAESQTENQPSPSYGGGDEYYAMATLQLPLELLAASPRGRSTARAKEEAAGPAPGTESGAHENQTETLDPEVAESGKTSVPSAAATSPSQAEPTRPPAASLSAVEPPRARDRDRSQRSFLRLVRETARRVSGQSGAADRRMKSLVRRSRWSGLMPELRLRGVTGFDRTTSTEDSVGIYPGETTVRGATDSLAEARLTFHLDRLVLGDGEESLERQRGQREQEIKKQVAEAIELLVAWRVARERSRDEDLLPEERVEAEIEMESTLAQLYLATNGWFRGDVTLHELGVELPELGASER